MENIFLNVKTLIFFGLMVVVIAMLSAVLIAVVYQVIRDKVRETRRLDGVVQESADPSSEHAAVGHRHL